MHETELRKKFPIIDIIDGKYINWKEDITAGISLMMPPVYSITGDQYNTITEVFENILNSLPPFSVFHKQDFYYVLENNENVTENDDSISKEDKKYFNGRGLFLHHSDIYITYSSSGMVKKRPLQSSLFQNIDWVKGKGQKNLESAIYDSKQETKDLIANINSMEGYHAVQKGKEEMLAGLRDYFCQDYENQRRKKGNYSIPPMHVSDGNFMIGDKYIKVLSLNKEGGMIYSYADFETKESGVFSEGIAYDNKVHLPKSYLFPISLGLPIKHMVNTIIQVYDKETMHDYITKKIKGQKIGIGIGNDESAMLQNELTVYKSDMVNHGLRGCTVAVNVILEDRDKHKLLDTCGKVESQFNSIAGAKAWVENEDTANLFFCSCPGNGGTNYRSIPSTTKQAACYINKETQYTSDLEGTRFVDRFGNPVYINLWNNKLIYNKNGLIIGASGTGKSVNINQISSEFMVQGGHVTIIDIGHSYKRNCQEKGGKYISSSNMRMLATNPFLCKRDHYGNYVFMEKDEDGDGEFDKVNYIKQVIAFLWKRDDKLDFTEDQILQDSIIAFYKHINKEDEFPDLITYDKYLYLYEEKGIKPERKKYIDFESIHLMLSPFVDGQHKELLNARENPDIINDRFIIYELEGIKKDKTLFTLMSMVIIELFTQKLTKVKGAKKILIIDEALDFLKDPKMGDFIAFMYRTCRKKNGSVYIAAQSIEFLKATTQEIKASILGNCDIRLILDHKNYKSAYKEFMNMGVLTNEEIEKLDSVNSGLAQGKRYTEFLLKLGDFSIVLRNEISPFSEMVYTSNEEEVSAIKKKFEKYGNQADAIKEFAKEKYGNLKARTI